MNLERTKKAIEVYDAYADDYRVQGLAMSPEQQEIALDHLERLGEAVGEAYGMDTAGQNDPQTCKDLIRPGPKVPGPGQELSFVRRMVALPFNGPRVKRSR